MNTEIMSDELYNSIIYTKEELQFKYAVFRQSTIPPTKIDDYIKYCVENNYLYNLITNYEIFKKIKSDCLINYNKRLGVI